MPCRSSRPRVWRVSSARTTSASRSSASTRSVTSSRLPIGVAQTASGTHAATQPRTRSGRRRSARPRHRARRRSISSSCPAGASASRRTARPGRGHRAGRTRRRRSRRRSRRARAEDVDERADRDAEVVADLARAPDAAARRGRARSRPAPSTSRASLSAARPEQYASTWPRPEHAPWHGSPSSTITMWPSSVHARKSCPSATTPPPTPVPSVSISEVVRAAARARARTRRRRRSSRRSPSRPAARAALPSPSRNGTSWSGMLTAPSASRARGRSATGMPKPTAATPSSGSARTSVGELVEQGVLRGRHRRALDRPVDAVRRRRSPRRGSSSRRGRPRSHGSRS